LDVFEEEPKIHPGLLRNPNVMLVPHMGTWSYEVRFSPPAGPLSCFARLTFLRLKLKWRNGLLGTCVRPLRRGR
jgi:hypothetical protein